MKYNIQPTYKMFRRKLARRPRRRAVRRSKIGPPRAGLQLKPYSYKFQLLSQVLRNQNANAGVMQFSNLGGQQPLASGNISVGSGSCALPDYYDVAIACPFQLADLTHSGNFTAMYDAYKITKVTLTLEYLNNMASVAGLGLMPTSYMVWDQDDAVIPPTLSSITGKQGVRVRQFGNNAKSVHSFTLRPVVNTVMGQQGGPNLAIPSGINSKSQWIDCAYNNVTHNALKIFLTDVYLPSNPNVNQAFRFNWTYHVSFRAPLLTT